MAIAMKGKWQAGNLSPEPTSLIGRQDELGRIRRACRDARLVTLTGVGGVGKTRLALRAAADMRPGGGAWLVELSALDDGTLLPHAIAEALRLTDQTSRPMAEVLAEHLCNREVLVVLDSCEHLTAACAAMVETLIEAVPGLRVLATSRRPLGVSGELVIEVGPLPVPAEDATTPGGGDAVALLAERAAEIVPEFELAEHNRQAAVRLCRRLEGLPLAIELAAARVCEFPIELMVARLTDPSRGGGEPLRVAVEWSHELCEPAERLLWARLSVFAGDFDVEAARSVCADERVPEADIGLLLDALAGEAILTWLPTGAGERYRMRDTLREYGAARLRDLGEQERFRQRHREHYASLATRGAALWLGPGQISWYDRMIGEHANLRTALETALGGPDGQTAADFAGKLAFFWYGCGYAKEGRSYLRRALAMDVKPGPVLLQALWADGLLAAHHGDADGAEARAAEIAEIAAEDDPYAIRCAGALRAAAGMVRGDSARTMAESEHAFRARWSGEEPSIAMLLALLCRGHACTVDGRFEEALAVFDDLRTLCDQRGEVLTRSHGDLLRGYAELAGGRFDAAIVYGQAALRVKRRLRDGFGIGLTVDLLALAAGAAGRAERAARLFGLARRIWSTHGLTQANVPVWVAARKACERQTRDTLGDDAYHAAFCTGFDREIDAGLAYALEPEGEGRPNNGSPM
ncbi:ATP-binding protein [Nonomuraea purpurea]|uniref:ATP-binding protein n=1 Tax=Nonomuraea purpurea TaxID=1849276 RepID=A0ABV8G0B0_9ACTN